MHDDENMSSSYSNGHGADGGAHGDESENALRNGTIMAHGRQGLSLARPGQGEPEGQSNSTNYVRVVLQSLRGRYLLAIISGIVWAVIFSAAVWYFASPTYHSESLIRIAYARSAVMHETDQNAPLPMFDAFMASQRLLITSRRVVDTAIQDPVWKAMGRPVPNPPDKYFAEHLTVEIQHGSEFIRIVVKDKEPGTPAAAVTAVATAYADLFNQQEKTMERSRLGLLEDRQGVLKATMDQLQNDLNTRSKEFGTTDLTHFIENEQAQLNRVETTLANVRLALLGVSGLATTQPSTQPSAAAEAALAANLPARSGAREPEEVAQFDLQLRTALEDEAHLKDTLNKLEHKGILENNPTVKDLHTQLDAARDRIRSRMETQENFRSRTGHYLGEPAVAAGGAAPGMTGRSPEQLKADEINLEHLRDSTLAELKTTGNKHQDMLTLKKEIDVAQTEYDQLSTRMETLRTEGAIGSRLSTISIGEIALSPDTDPRYKLLPVAALFGMVFPVACIVLLATLKGRVRYSDETETAIMPDIPFLGILPELGKDDLEGSELSIAAAHSVHQIRVAIQSHDHDAEHRCYLVTSATAGEGKTGLTMSLGLSYAASQLKTLVIDCDLVGRNLTSRMDAKDWPGLREAMEAGTMAGLIREMGNGLWVLTAGLGTSADAYTISAIRIRKLLAEARKEFDIILIDTGPILGSIEANILAREVDGVILAVARGRERGMVRSAVRKLNMLGARPIGFVFNRAAPTDFERSPYSSISSVSVVSASRDVGMTMVRGETSAHLKEFGPLVQAMAPEVAEEKPQPREE